MSLSQEAGAYLRSERERQGKTLRALAEEVGLSNPTLHHYETGQGNPTLSKLEEIGAIYGVEFTIRAKRIPRPPARPSAATSTDTPG